MSKLTSNLEMELCVGKSGNYKLAHELERTLDCEVRTLFKRR